MTLPKSDMVEAAIDRILLLEKSNVGCSDTCICRAYLGFSFSDEQMQDLKAHEKKVAAGEIESNEPVTAAAIRDLDPMQEHFFKKIEHDRHGRPQAEIVGGEEGALAVIETWYAQQLMKEDIEQAGATLIYL